MPRIPVGKLWNDTVGVQPITIDWQERLGEDLDGWRSVEVCECSECGKVVVAIGPCGEDRHSDMDEESRCPGYVGPCEGPMMNYYYPLPELRVSEEESARLIAHLPLCLVELEETWALALTGGGMDLSWEICEAFMLLGWLPPLHFADLPAMAGKTLNARNAWIIAGCRRTCEVVRWRAARRKQTLTALRKRMKTP